MVGGLLGTVSNLYTGGAAGAAKGAAGAAQDTGGGINLGAPKYTGS